MVASRSGWGILLDDGEAVPAGSPWVGGRVEASMDIFTSVCVLASIWAVDEVVTLLLDSVVVVLSIVGALASGRSGRSDELVAAARDILSVSDPA